ncbi:MAG: guanylate kinase [Pseudomonadota bacterium]
MSRFKTSNDVPAKASCMNRVNHLYVLAAPSGAGKTTLVKALVARNPGYRFSISYTTRPIRSTEVDGVDYFFVSQPEFNRLRDSGELLESAIVFGKQYGTSRSQVERHLADGHDVILEIDWQGARQVRTSMPESISVFILPPSREELERRLRGRGTDSDEEVNRRLSEALSDMGHWDEFDYCIVNDHVDDAVDQLEAIFAGEGHDNGRENPNLRRRIENILV